MLAKISVEFRKIDVLIASILDRDGLLAPGRSEDLPNGPLFQPFSASRATGACFPPTGTPPPQSGLGPFGVADSACFRHFSAALPQPWWAKRRNKSLTTAGISEKRPKTLPTS